MDVKYLVTHRLCLQNLQNLQNSINNIKYSLQQMFCFQTFLGEGAGPRPCELLLLFPIIFFLKMYDTCVGILSYPLVKKYTKM